MDKKIDTKEMLRIEKVYKKKQIQVSKENYKNRIVPVVLNLAGEEKTYHFFGGEEAYKTYKNSLDTALFAGVKEGTVFVKEGAITVNQEAIQKAIAYVGIQNHKADLKEFYYSEAIEAANTLEEVLAIKWEDERG